jgi:hypothetical protein
LTSCAANLFLSQVEVVEQPFRDCGYFAVFVHRPCDHIVGLREGGFILCQTLQQSVPHAVRVKLVTAGQHSGMLAKLLYAEQFLPQRLLSPELAQKPAGLSGQKRLRSRCMATVRGIR